MRFCYICGQPKACEWHSLWYDGATRHICSLLCRNRIEQLWSENPDKQYPNKPTNPGGMTVSEFDFEKKFRSVAIIMRDYDKDVMRRVGDTATAKAATALVNAESKTLHMIRGHNKDNTHLTKSDVREIVRGELEGHLGAFHDVPEDILHDKPDAEKLQVQLAACSVAALGGTSNPSERGDYGWSVSYQDVLDLRVKYDALKQPDAEPQGVYVEPGDVVVHKTRGDVMISKNQTTWGAPHIRVFGKDFSGALHTWQSRRGNLTLDGLPVLGVR